MASILAPSTAIGRFFAGIVLRKLDWLTVLVTCFIVAAALVLAGVSLADNAGGTVITRWSTAPLATFIFSLIGFLWALFYPAINSAILSSLPRPDLIESMTDNFTYLIRTYGHIPNGNRKYYLSRSQPPFFALIVTLLAEIGNDEKVYLQYSSELQTEYKFWQYGVLDTTPDTAKNRVVQMPGSEMLI